jgi:hypothetical protein
MYDNQLDYRAIQRRADAAVRQQQFRTRLGLFLADLILFVAFILLGWANIGGRGLYPDQFFFTTSLLSIGWFIGLVLHGTLVWLSSERGTRRMRERAVAREIAQEMSRQGVDERDRLSWDEKAKRRQQFTEIDDEEVQVNLADLIDREPTYKEDTR